MPKFKPRTNLPDGDDWLTRAWASVGMWIVRHYKPVTAVGVLVLFGVGYGTTKINTSVQLLKLFDGESKIIKDYEWLEANVGKLVPMELVVRVSPDMVRPAREELAESGTAAAHRQRFQLSFLERAELTARVQEVVEKEFGEQGQGVVGRAMSAVTLMPQLPPPAGASAFGRDYLERTKFLKDMEASRAELMSSDFLRLDEDLEHEGSELWRISLRVGALNDVDYGLFVHELKDAIEPVMAAYRYRDQILHGIDEKRGGEGFWKTADHGIPRVLVLGAADPDEVTTAEAATEEASSENLADENATDKADNATGSQAEQVAANRAEPSAHSIEQSHIFAKTLKDLLVNASFRKTTWHDPVTKPVREVAADDEQWGKAIEAFDAVVVMDDHADYDLDFIKQHASVFVDARQHRYNFDAGMPTANQEDRPIHTVYTGLVPVVYKAQRTLLISLIESIGWAFVLIAAVMTMLLNPGKTWRDSLRPKNLALSLGAGLSSMLPNVFPVALIFGLMGYMGRRVDIGSMMTASVAMGVAVDDTIHFLTWYRDGIRMGLRRKDAIVLAYKRCAAAMTQTTLIGGLGLSVFALSTFTPTQQFGTLMLALLAAALVGDLLFLPAILAGPLGKFFTPEREEDEPSSGSTPSAANSAEATESALATTSPDNGANADGKVTPGEERRETVSMAEPRRVDARRRVAAPADSPNGDEGEHREPATSITDTGAEDDTEADQTARQQQTPAASLGGSNGQPPKGKPGQGPHISHADRAAQRPQFTRRDEAH
ncbi:MAG: MMPL family transporter [Pirellulaceae bacterium]